MEGRMIELDRGMREEQGSSCRCSAASPAMAYSEMEAALALADLALIRGGDDQQHTVAGSSCLSNQGRPPDKQEREWKVHKFLAKKAQKGYRSFNSNVQCLKTHQTLRAGAGSMRMANEDGKEAKQMRRVLANRESARQTIRKRQAMREDLTKSVSELQIENERLKIEKEMVTKEYQLLQDRNQNLTTWIMIASGKKISSALTSQTAVEFTRKSKQPVSSNEFLSPTPNSKRSVPQFFRPAMAAHHAHPHPDVPPRSKGNVGLSSQVDPYKWLDHPTDVNSMMPLCLVPYPWYHSIPTECCSRQCQPCPPRSSLDDPNFIPNNAVKRSLEMARLCLTSRLETNGSYSGLSHSNVARQSWQEENWARSPQHGMLEATSSNLECEKEEYARSSFMACQGSSKTVVMAAEARKRRREITKLKLQYYPKLRRPPRL